MQWPVPCSASLVLVEIPQHSLELKATLMAPCTELPSRLGSCPLADLHMPPHRCFYKFPGAFILLYFPCL